MLEVVCVFVHTTLSPVRASTARLGFLLRSCRCLPLASGGGDMRISRSFGLKALVGTALAGGDLGGDPIVNLALDPRYGMWPSLDRCRECPSRHVCVDA